MKPASEIPRPAGSLVSHTRRFVKNTMQFYEESFRECGDIFTTRIPGLGNWTYICSPDLVKAVFEAPPDVVSADIEGFSVARVLGRGATSQLDGPAHKERRDVISPYLGAQESARQVDGIRRITERRLAEWPLGQPFKLVLALQKISLEALIHLLFAGVDPERARQLADLWEDFSFKGMRSLTVPHTSLQLDFPGSPWRKVKQRREKVQTAFLQEIEERLAAEPTEADGFVLGMARARLRDGSQLSREIILSEILDLLFQGHEQTGNSMTWTLGELLTHPEALARLRQELETVAGQGDLQSGHLADLPYLDAVVYEGLRRRPNNLFTGLRMVKKPFALGGYLLPEGSLVAVSYPAQSVRPDLFAHPERFDPGHFYQKQKPPAEAWSPFGSGAHACAGKDFAIVVIKTVLATIVRKADLKLAQSEIKPVRNAYYYEPNQGLLVTFDSRRS
ncbi:MAG TPA: cytochrome P450 [Thermoanaerobaculia bacterium]|jgi:cytochrome P450|nr:cytochrome P450 [Thermoanaerobaculia bacterium]